MNQILSRQPVTKGKKEYRHLVIGLAVLLIASAGWRIVRPIMVNLVACSSVGCWARCDVIAAALRARYPEYPPEAMGAGLATLSSCRPAPGTVLWINDKEFQEQRASASNIIQLADASLNHLGLFRLSPSRFYTSGPHADWDGDGRYEVTCCGYVDDNSWLLYQHMIIRLGMGSNEIAGLFIVDNSHTPQNTTTYALWRDEDGDGLNEYVIHRVTVRRLPKPKPWHGKPETVAVFEWDRPGGVLRPRVLPDDGSITVWTPPDGQPYEFPADAVVDDICQELLSPPIPE